MIINTLHLKSAEQRHKTTIIFVLLFERKKMENHIHIATLRLTLIAYTLAKLRLLSRANTCLASKSFLLAESPPIPKDDSRGSPSSFFTSTSIFSSPYPFPVSRFGENDIYICVEQHQQQMDRYLSSSFITLLNMKSHMSDTYKMACKLHTIDCVVFVD